MSFKESLTTNIAGPLEEETHEISAAMQNKQRLRLQRFGMAVATYAIVILATALTTRLGLGVMKPSQWMVFVGMAVIGNTVFFLIFYFNANLCFSDHSLTREQIVFSALWGMIPLYFLPQARPVVLMFYLPAFSFGVFRLTHRQYLTVVACVMGMYGLLLALEVFQGGREFSPQYELFLFILYGILLTWFAVFGGHISNIRFRLRAQNREIRRAHDKIKAEIDERKRAQIEKDNLIIHLQEAIKKVKTLSGMLPICAACKKIRDDKGYWNQIESYIRKNSEAEFSHSICPDCARRLYSELNLNGEDDH